MWVFFSLNWIHLFHLGVDIIPYLDTVSSFGPVLNQFMGYKNKSIDEILMGYKKKGLILFS
jgi:hypothetical protein